MRSVVEPHDYRSCYRSVVETCSCRSTTEPCRCNQIWNPMVLDRSCRPWLDIMVVDHGLRSLL